MSLNHLQVPGTFNQQGLNKYLSFPGDSTVKNLSANAEHLGLTQVREIPDQEDPLEEKMAIHSSILAWEIPWTEEPGGLYSPWGHKESDMTERLHSHFSNLEKHFFFFFHKESLGKMRTERPQNTIFLIGLHSPEQVNSLPKVIWFLISKVTVRSSW